MQAIAAGVILLGFVIDWHLVVLVAAIGLAGAFAADADNVRPYGRTWVTEEVLLALSAFSFLVGRAGYAWVLALLAAFVAALAAAAEVWIGPVRRQDHGWALGRWLPWTWASW